MSRFADVKTFSPGTPLIRLVTISDGQGVTVDDNAGGYITIDDCGLAQGPATIKCLYCETKNGPPHQKCVSCGAPLP